MKRKLITQMRNEWRSNVWMTVELVIVGVVLWGVFSIFAGLIWLYQEPRGIDFSNICIGDIGYIPDDAQAYKAYPDSLHNYNTDLEMILAKVRANPNVVSVGTGINAIPYNFNYNGNSYRAQVGDTVQLYSGNIRNMSPDMMRTLRMTGINGESTESLAAMLSRGEALISPADRPYYKNTPEKWVGKDMWNAYDSTQVIHVGALVNGIRRSDFEPIMGGVVICNIPDDSSPQEIAVRVRPGAQQQYLESLKAADLEFGNVYIVNMRTIESRREVAHHDITVLVRNLTACALFVMVAVFLGFLGSFWYRTQQRVPELALRKVNGATDADIFRRFLSEGLILLLVSLPFIAAVVWLLISNFLDLEDAWIPIPEYLIWAMVPVTALVLALMICAGIWLPARKAMRINPAEALKDQ